MTDRVPGAPGQYKAVVAEAELQKMQAGESFIITMTRDDQPITEGTPYSKATVLPDELAQLLCPNKEDPTPAEALAALLPLSGGTMTGDLSMGFKAIYDVERINNLRIQSFDAGSEDTYFSIPRKTGREVFLMFGQTQDGPCLYLLTSHSSTDTSLGVNKLFGNTYATILGPQITSTTITFAIPKHSRFALVGI